MQTKIKTLSINIIFLCVFLVSNFAYSSDKPEQKIIPVPEIASAKLPESFACHVQGITFYKDYLFSSCSSLLEQEAYLLRYKLPENFESTPLNEIKFNAAQVKDVTFDGQLHASGLDHDQDCIWIASANYRPFFADSEIMCIAPETLKTRHFFSIDDHIGTLAVSGDFLFLMNWGSKQIYRTTKQGKVLGKYANPTGMAYQDCRGGKVIRCVASDELDGEMLTFVDALGFNEKQQQLVLSARKALFNNKVNLGREGFTQWNKGLYFLPEDYPNARLIMLKQ